MSPDRFSIGSARVSDIVSDGCSIQGAPSSTPNRPVVGRYNLRSKRQLRAQPANLSQINSPISFPNDLDFVGDTDMVVGEEPFHGNSSFVSAEEGGSEGDRTPVSNLREWLSRGVNEELNVESEPIEPSRGETVREMVVLDPSRLTAFYSLCAPVKGSMEERVNEDLGLSFNLEVGDLDSNWA